MLVDYFVKRGRVYADVKDLIAMFAEYDCPSLPKVEIVEALRNLHDKAVNRR